VSGGVSLARLDEDLPTIDATEGVVVRHLVGQSLMFRLVELEAQAILPIEELEQEHILVVTAGTVRVEQGGRQWEVPEGTAAVLLAGRGFSLASVSGPASCQLSSTPPNVDLVRDLVHLEHADHGFD
jgi:hypothetical protein